MGHIWDMVWAPSDCCPQRHAPFENVLWGLLAQRLQKAVECSWKKSGDFPRRSWQVIWWNGQQLGYNMLQRTACKHVPCQYVIKDGLFLHATMCGGWQEKTYGWSCLFHADLPKFRGYLSWHLVVGPPLWKYELKLSESLRRASYQCRAIQLDNHRRISFSMVLSGFSAVFLFSGGTEIIQAMNDLLQVGQVGRRNQGHYNMLPPSNVCWCNVAYS